MCFARCLDTILWEHLHIFIVCCAHAIKIIKIRLLVILIFSMDVRICLFRVSIWLFRCSVPPRFLFSSCPHTLKLTELEPHCHRNGCHFATLHQYIQLNREQQSNAVHFHFKLNSLPEYSHFVWQRTLTIAQSVTLPHSGTPIRFRNNFKTAMKKTNRTQICTRTLQWFQSTKVNALAGSPLRTCLFVTGNSILDPWWEIWFSQPIFSQ